MKKLFSEAEIELTLISALDDILAVSGDVNTDTEDLGSVGDNRWDEG